MKSTQVIKQVVGIDVGKDTFYACIKIKHYDGKISIKGSSCFNNDISGMNSFLKWCTKRCKESDSSIYYVMEATGVYYENLAYFLYENEQIVSVHLAQKLKYFAKGCNLKTKTDKVDANMIASFGIEKQLEKSIWEPLSSDFKIIRDLAREHNSLKKNITAAKSQLHALNESHSIYDKVIGMKTKMIDFYSNQLIEIEKEILRLVKKNEQLYEKVKKIETVKGLGFMTIIKVISEVNGFLLFKNIPQLISYAGLDIVENESGKFKGRTKISKRGNARIRSALYMPAMSASRYNSQLKSFYERVNEPKDIKKRGIVAVMRKLLILIYTLWKKNEEYNENYHQMKFG